MIPLPPLQAGNLAPVFIALNAKAGGDHNGLAATITEALREHGHEVTLVEIAKGDSLTDACEHLVKMAAEKHGMMVAAGGDGTVNAVARLCHKHGAIMGVIPLGTFNYFARTHNIPTTLEDALNVITSGTPTAVSAGFVHDHLFLNNASFGLYPTLIRRREQATSRFGRKRLVAAFSALRSLFRDQKIFSIRMHSDGGGKHHRTSMVFVGNNTLQLENIGLEGSTCTADDALAVVILKPLTRLQTCRLIWRGIAKKLSLESKLEEFCTHTLEVSTPRAKIDVAIDGEIVRCASPLHFRVEANALRVITPMQVEEA